MEFADKIQALAKRARETKDRLVTEEATKNALVMPLLAALGYDVFDPNEVIPEYTADIGSKKGEKVDYAVMQGGVPMMLIECKAVQHALRDAHSLQLYRYFTSTDAPLGVLTNGIEYQFFMDLEEKNRMDAVPFFVFSLERVTEPALAKLKRFAKADIDLAGMAEAAAEMKYSALIRDVFESEIREPSDDFVRFFIGATNAGRVTKSLRETFTPLVARVINQYITDRISGRLQVALEQEVAARPVEAVEGQPEVAEAVDVESAGDDIETTEEEILGFRIVQAIVASVLGPDRVVMRDTKSYCGILVDDNNRKPLCRLRFNASSVKYLGLFDEQKKEEKLALTSVEEIYQHSDKIREAAQRWA